MPWPRPVRIVGVGSPQGDDAVAWEVVRQMRERLAGEPGVELHVADGGQRLLDLLDGRGSLVLIDAAAGDGKAGEIYRLEWPDPRLEVLRASSTHGLGLAAALQLAAAIGLLPSRIAVFGIQAGNLVTGPGLSAAAARAVPEVMHRIFEELEGEGAAANA